MSCTRKIEFSIENIGHLLKELNAISDELKDLDNLSKAYEHLEHAQMNLNMIKFTVHTVISDIGGRTDEHYYY